MKKYILLFCAGAFIAFIGGTIYTQVAKEKLQDETKRLACHKHVTTFERGYGFEDIKKAQQLLLDGNYKINSSVEKSIFMPSTLFDFIDMDILDKKLDSIISEKMAAENLARERVEVYYKVYENDKQDPKKKGESCKLFRGYVVMKFENQNNKTVYQIQIDFLDDEGSDIPETLKCAVESFVTYKE